MVHGLSVGADLAMLVYGAATVGLTAMANGALALVLEAAAGGLALRLMFHAKALALPKWLVAVHGSIAALGFALLLSATPGGVGHLDRPARRVRGAGRGRNG